MNRWSTLLRRPRLVAAAWFAAYLPRLSRRRPPVRLDLEGWLPNWSLRLALGLLALGCAAPVVRSPLSWVLTIAVAASMIIWPSGVGPAAFVITIGVLAALRGDPPTAMRTTLLLVGLHAVAQLALVIGRTSLTARIEIAAVLVPLPRFVVVQAFAQTLALLGGWLAGWFGGRDLGLAALPLLAILGLAVIAYVWLPGLGHKAASPSR